MKKTIITSVLIFLIIFCGQAVIVIAGDEPQQSKTGPVPPAAVIERDATRIEAAVTQEAIEQTILGVPDYNWRHGCGPTSMGMVVGYYDGQGYDDLIPADASTQTDAVNQAIASGGNSANPNPAGSEQHYEDYCRPEDPPPDPIQTDDYITSGRTPHPEDSIADYMDTSKSTRNNRYGWSFSSDLGPSFVGYVNQQNSSYAPSYTEYSPVTGNAMTWNILTNEIDNGRPMVFLVDTDGNGGTDHFVAVVGYRDSPSQQYGCHDTWAPTGVRWEDFEPMSSGQPWGIWGGWSFRLGGSENRDPVLSNPRVNPISGTESTNFEFLVDYYDADGDPPDPIYRKVYISGTGGQAEGIMSLKSGSDANGTYHYTRTLPIGFYSYMFMFSDTEGAWDMTSWRGGPYVYSDDDAVINIVIQCTRISLDLRLRYSLTGSGGPWTDIPITKQILDPIVVPSGSTVYFQADVVSPNYEYREWELIEDGSLIGSGTGSMWWVTLGPSTTEIGLNVYYRYTPQNYTISGTVLGNDGNPIPDGVDVTLKSEQNNLSQHTDNGNFLFSSVQGGVDVVVTPCAAGYQFSPPSLTYNNLQGDHTGETITGYPSDKTSPMTSFLIVPPVVGEESSVSFSWIGDDDVSEPANLLYQYKLAPVDSDGSSWVSDTSKSYDLKNGVYTFEVAAKDEAGNENQAPKKYTFVINAAPRVFSAIRTKRSVWASRVSLEMPASPNHPNDVFILLPEYSGTSDSELVPVTIHRVDEATACGGNEIVAGELGLTVRISKAASGWLVTLPETVPTGQSVEYDIVWGKIKYFGWQENVSVPLNFPNVGQKYPPNYSDVSKVDNAYLDNNLRLWRTAFKWLYFGMYIGERDTYVLMNISNKNGPILEETILRYTPGSGWDGNYGRDNLYTSTRIIPVGFNIALLWRDLKGEYYKSTNTSVNNYRTGVEIYDYMTLGHFANDGPYSEDFFPYLPTRSIGDNLWCVDTDDTTARFWVLNSDGSEIVSKTPFDTFNQPRDPDLYLNRPLPIGNNVFFVWVRAWRTDNDYERDRKEIHYQVRDQLGNIVIPRTVLTPVISDSIDKNDEYTDDYKITDKEGKLWFSYTHYQTGQGNKYYYIVFDPNGSICKGPNETPAIRCFRYCDKDGLIWATEGNQLYLLNPDDTNTISPRDITWIPDQDVSNIAADVSASYDGYRLYDRWSPQIIEIDVPSGVCANSMLLFDANLWDNELHIANPNLMKGDTSVWNHSGQFSGHVDVNVPGVLDEGSNILTMTQDDFLGGQVLVTFPYIICIDGDINCDGKVNKEDLRILASQWLEPPGTPSADLAPSPLDNFVNFHDLAVLGNNWNYEKFEKFYDFALDTNPGWSTEGEWAFGQPTGGGGTHGNPDPTSGYSGLNVYGVNLNGDYSTVVGGPYHLTSGPFDCSEYHNIWLKFARWLNTDAPSYVSNKIEASNNGSDWILVWEHTESSDITDDSWQALEYNISSTADGQATVFIRWSYEILDSHAFQCSGWNIDDVELWGNPG